MGDLKMYWGIGWLFSALRSRVAKEAKTAAWSLTRRRDSSSGVENVVGVTASWIIWQGAIEQKQ
eukprot:7550818-Pyramimonas_sp.AAC.1